ncbi:head-tail connector protein [Vannielia litorea]|uniref:PhiE125 gp8 family phage protein n=1 Tax=Vannielia litorea TaxID=1217970 RepID=A0A1N6F1P2_9RHOB|nr:hypothetical protein [Vannielia litorea]SIN89137.1 phage conserved hypothetical protein, phiE125 gp8 family [Vannielia litorea]
MILTELTTVSAAALPVVEFKAHLRMGTGFSDEGAEDGLLESLLRAAMAAVEAWTGKVLLARDFRWVLAAWRGGEGMTLPVAPVRAITAVKLVDLLDWEDTVDPGRYRLEPDTHRPRMRPTGSAFPGVPRGGKIVIDFAAGFGPAWSDIPADLGQAVLLLAGHYYDYRHEARPGEGVIPYGVSALIERWRSIRITGGRT